MATNKPLKPLKRSLSLDFNLDAEQLGQIDQGSFKLVGSRKSRRKAAKKARVADQPDHGPSGDTVVSKALVTNVADDDDLTALTQTSSQASVVVSQLPTLNNSSQLDVDGVIVCCHSCQKNESITESLKSELKQLKETVKYLSSQVEALTSSLGLMHIDSTKSSLSELSQAPTSNDRTAAAATRSYASVAAVSTSTIRDVHRSIVSVVYKDQEDKKKRANNIVVSGMIVDEQFEDKAVVAGMICHEFDRQVTVKSCRRLGRPAIGKVPNLLVSLSSAEDASYLVSNAKLLRRSQNEFVRKQIFINADLTPAEAKAAYELRCARRQRAVTSRNRRGEGEPVTSRSTDTTTTASDTAQLSVTAAPFVPSPSLSVMGQRCRTSDSTATAAAATTDLLSSSSSSTNIEDSVQAGRHR